MIEKYNKKYRTKEVLFNCEMIPAENVGVKHAKWDKEAGFQTYRECYNSYFYIVEDKSLNIVDKFRLHGHRYIEHLTGGSALHMNLEEHLSKSNTGSCFVLPLPKVATTSHSIFRIQYVTNAIISTNGICMNVPNVTARMWII